MKILPTLSRRMFISSNIRAAIGACVLPTIVPVTVLGGGRRVAPSNRIAVGCIGLGPQGRGVMSNFLSQSDCQVIALCDVFKRNLTAAIDA
ncbi:MAG: hypothetical protein N3G20_06920, partial [Verrucomicrobiae bacterium]|nr:hypothetical protein [Verrucomicrobiae bacterium]